MAEAASRVGWVDTAKGICIIFVVMMHSTLGVGLAMGAEGWMHHVVAFARPFRMPDFFLISGLFLGLVIDRPWLRYIDRKVVHFLYFYILWLTIQFALKAPGMAMENGMAAPFVQYLHAFIQPFGTLWFVYILPIFFVLTRMLKSLPVWFVLTCAAIFEILPIHTGWMLIDEFCARYVYFFVGYALAARIFALADWAAANRTASILLLVLWALVNAALVFSPVPWSLEFAVQPLGAAEGEAGLAALPYVSLALGAAGARAMVTVRGLGADAAWSRGRPWMGADSGMTSLAFCPLTGGARTAEIRLGRLTNVGATSLLVTIGGVRGTERLWARIQMTGSG